MESASPSYTDHRHPVEIIAHCVWLCFRFPTGQRGGKEAVFVLGALRPRRHEVRQT
ncbi:hypothetical protein [Streptomyces sp. NPDC017993]|uniref:hypothetical protein n=1 Tax=Streptomyces sp. NPDC017993 TaxID=3365027 RepID=UPI0037BB1BFD